MKRIQNEKIQATQQELISGVKEGTKKMLELGEQQITANEEKAAADKQAQAESPLLKPKVDTSTPAE